MIPSIKQTSFFYRIYHSYLVLFFLFLAAPLVVVAAFAFNDSLFPSFPWEGFTLSWFFSETGEKIGIFFDSELLESIALSSAIAIVTTLCATLVACTNAFLFERYSFPGKSFLYVLMLLPLVIPGVLLGVSILVFSSSVANYFEDYWFIDLEFLRPGLTLVVIGQFAFITTICTLIISARLRKFDLSLEEAALNLGATPIMAVFTVTLPYLKPALIGAAIVSFLMSFENFNTTFMLVGSDAPLTVAMYERLREGSTPVLNAISVLLMLGSAVLAIINMSMQKKA
ncbi:ABC transporter permease [Marinomonas sp. C2222]|uniref:ABC transporter permease n=1 Tax=Marinomonas sargassi TaxID=2984494 RepID=A0ABT2YTB4_9GAMM|nr:ABC transporter permease [Marinomonas sargassi]MCV2403137.1 ABC transporter permease [Marinomonas sargassi]